MARNQEKAQSMLHRFREAQMQEAGLSVPYEGRPRDPRVISTIGACERWRSQIVKEISSKIAQIQDGVSPLA